MKEPYDEDITAPVDDYVIDLRNTIMRALLIDQHRTAEDIDEFMELTYPVAEEFEYLDWQAMNVLLALVEANEMMIRLTPEQIAVFKKHQKTIYSPSTLDPSLVRKIS